MNREKLAWSASAALLAALAFQLPGSLAQRDDDYAFARTLLDVHRRVVDNYVDPVNADQLNTGAIDGMLAQLDPYSNFVPPERQEDFNRLMTGNFKGVGIKLEQRATDGAFVIVTPVDGSPAAASGLLPGDVLLAVDGHPLADGLRILDLIKIIGGPIDTTVSLTVRHADGGPPATYKMKRAEVHQPTVKGYRRAADNSWNFVIGDDPRIGYVRLTQFTGNSYAEVRAAVDGLLAGGMKGLVLDLRFNPGGELEQAERIIDVLVPKGRTILTTRGTHRPEQRAISDGRDSLPDFPLVVLVNEYSASAAEIVSGSLMDNGRAVVVGQRTFGKGSVQEVVALPDAGGELKLTVAYYYLPSGRLVHRRKDATDWGVNPQVVVPLDPPAEARLLAAQEAADVFRRPGATAPATRPGDGDPQLRAAIDTLVGAIVFRSHVAATRP